MSAGNGVAVESAVAPPTQNGNGTLDENQNSGTAAGGELQETTKELSPANMFDVYKAEGNGLVKAEKLDEALEKYELAWKESRSDDDRAMILNNKGVVAEKKGDVDKAIEWYTEALKLKSGYIKVYIRRGVAYKKLKKFEESIDDITEAHVLALKHNQVLEGFQENIVAPLILDSVEVEMTKLRAERKFPFPMDYHIQSHFRQFYCDPVSRVWKGLESSPLDEFKAAQGDATPALNGFLAALDCIKSCKFSEIPEHCTEEIDNPSGKYRLEALLLRGSIHLLCGNKTESEADFKSIIDDPNASDNMKGCAHLKAAMLMNLWTTAEEAAAHFSDAEQLWKENADIYYQAALCLVEKGEAFPALALLEKGMEVCPDVKQHPLLHILCRTLKMTYNLSFENPKASMEKLKEMETDGAFDSPECYEFYAQALLLFDNMELALAQFDKATELANGERLFGLKKVMAKHLLANDPHETIKALEEYADDPLFGATAWYHMGELNAMLGNKEKSLEAVDMALEKSLTIYEARAKLMGRFDFRYGFILKEKMKKHGVDLGLENDVKNCCLE